jgi:hypothetical protein
LGVRLWIEGIELTCTSVLKDDDAGDVSLWPIGCQEIRQVNAGKRQASDPKKVATAVKA